jgi:uncharacterized protein YneR
MAIEQTTNRAGTAAPRGRRLVVGSNVALVTAIVIAIVVVAQVLAYEFTDRVRADMTSSGVNSLSEGTLSLLRGLETNLRLTSLYFETDREEADQSKYRRATQDLLELYEASNRGKITAEWVNPLKDHEKYQQLLGRLREKTAFADMVTAYQARVESYKADLDGRMRTLLQDELNKVGPIVGPATMGESRPSGAAQVEDLLRRLSAELETTREQIDALTMAAHPQYSTAVNELKTLYPKISKALKEIGKFAQAELAREPSMPGPQAEFLRTANTRYADLVAALEAETTKLQDLQPLKVDDVAEQIQPTANAILVETDADARVMDFNSVFPPMDPNSSGMRVPFEKRAFKGEEKLTAAILRVTQKEQTAVVFVRYGGQPLFFGGFMPGQPAAQYGMMKQQLEDANFIVEEWDLKTKDALPEIKPTPTRTIFIVLKPEQQQRNPMMPQQPPEQPFSDKHRQALLTAMGDRGRALFIAGWAPGPFGPIPSNYEYGEYLKQNWGINLDTSALLIQTASTAPGKYMVARRDFFAMDDLDVGHHPIVSGAAARRIGLPWCAPLDLTAPPPSGVTVEKLVTMPKRDGAWGVKNIQKYQEQLEQRDYMTKVEGDLEGPFDLAAAATKGDAKIVVVSSREFAEDDVAFARELGMSAQGFTIRTRNPGNVTLLINAMHWLNDNTGFMNIGRPIDAAVLEIESKSTLRAVQVLTIAGWPLLALVGGGVAWWVRRR